MLYRVSNTAVVHNTGVLFQEIPLLTHSLNSHCFCVIRYDEEQAQSENAERDLRSRSGQSLGSKGTKGSAGVRPTAATWKWSDNFSLKLTSCTTLQGPSVVNHLDFFFFSTLDRCSLHPHFTDCGTGSNGTAAQWRKISYVLTLRRLKSLCLSLFIWMYNKISGTDSALTGLRSNQVGQISHTAAVSTLKTSSDEIFGDGHEGLLCMTSDCWHFNLTFHTGANENIHCMVMKWYKVIK